MIIVVKSIICDMGATRIILLLQSLFPQKVWVFFHLEMWLHFLCIMRVCSGMQILQT